jgi:hypothetical protein
MSKMNTSKIIAALDEELARLRQVRELLTGEAGEAPRRRGPRAGARAAGRTPAAGKPARKKRVLSEEARQRIADAQKRRWAAAKRSAE